MTTMLRGPILWITERPITRRIVGESSLGKQLAGRFVAGDTLEDGMVAARGLSQRGIAAMLDYLGENAETPAQCAGAADAYIAALKRIRESPELDTNISVKLTQLGLDLSVEFCMENLERVLQVAAEPSPPVLVMIDMEASEYVDRTLDVYLAARDRYPAVGVCLQAYLHRTARDAARIGGPLATVRMAKGAYLESPDIAHRSMRDIRRNYGRVAATLLASGSTVHFATHDPRLVEGARRFIRTRGLSRTQYEFQMLFGIRRDLQARLVADGEPVRVYIPYGTEWYPYLTRRLAERPANIWFFLSNLVRVGG
ncbi:MAG TPA: proline dehydrogenase family protein [Actinomycetota bacterium]|nr:proline dehydrogenase family protein [Actinomycetota bacterium]